MTEHRDSLADQAASWVPPWERAPEPAASPPDEPAEPGPAPEGEAPADAFALHPDTQHPADGVAGVASVGAEQRDAHELSGERSTADDDGAHELSGERSTADDGAGPDAVPAEDSGTATALALIDDAELAAALEAILLVVDEPVSELVLAGVLEQPTDRVAAALAALSDRYTAAGHGFDLRRAAGGWRLYTRPEYASYVEKFILDGQQARLTQAALETLAVVAYKQPVTRSRISAIRGVNCDGVIRTLVNRGLVEECGTEPDSGAYLYRTTTLFLEKLGLDSVGELPSLAPFLPDDVEEIADAQG